MPDAVATITWVSAKGSEVTDAVTAGLPLSFTVKISKGAVQPLPSV